MGELFLILATLTILSAILCILLLISKKKSVTVISFIGAILLSLFLGVANFTGLPNNYIIHRVVAGILIFANAIPVVIYVVFKKNMNLAGKVEIIILLVNLILAWC